MLSTSYYLQQQRKENYDPKNKLQMETMFRVFLILFLIDLTILIFAISCALKLKLEPLYIVALIVAMFIPGIGFLVQLGVIIYYYLTHKHASASASSSLGLSSSSGSASSEAPPAYGAFRFF